MPVVVALAAPELRDSVVPAVLAGDAIAALAVTEASGGSDVAGMRTTARRDGDAYVVDGEKTFITSGVQADYILLAARTGSASASAGGLSLLLVDAARAEQEQPGALTRTPLDKMGWHASDTAALSFCGLRVPASRLVGRENEGFLAIMRNFNSERIMLASQAVAFSQVCVDEASRWARERQTFGKPLSERQVIRHRIVDMNAAVAAQRAHLYSVADRAGPLIAAGEALPETLVAEVCMLKNASSAAMERVASGAVQILGGGGYMRGSLSERIFRETKVQQIGGGSTEVMKDLAAKQLMI
jgi:acyl-CoA dehydrogenase